MGYSAPSLVLFDEVFDPMKKKLLLKIVIRKNRNFSYEHLNFFRLIYSKSSFRSRLKVHLE